MCVTLCENNVYDYIEVQVQVQNASKTWQKNKKLWDFKCAQSEKL